MHGAHIKNPYKYVHFRKIIVWTLELSTTFDIVHKPSITAYCSADNEILSRRHAEQGFCLMNINPFWDSREH